MTAEDSTPSEGHESIDESELPIALVNLFRGRECPVLTVQEVVDVVEREVSVGEATVALEDLERDGILASKEVGEHRIWWLYWSHGGDTLEEARERQQRNLRLEWESRSDG